jgi:hypothetical protein
MQPHDKFRQLISAAPQDVSLPVLEELLGEGYDSVLWHTSPGATDGPCISMNDERFPLPEFIANLQHAAPIFEKTHVGCRCSLTISGPGLEDVAVDWTGRLN